jgi:hypothetical protein
MAQETVEEMTMRNPLATARSAKVKWIGVTHAEVRRAVDKAIKIYGETHYDLYSAQRMEILLIPKIYKRWKQLADIRFAGGRPHPEMQSSIVRAANHFGPGYVVTIWGGRWNSLRDDYYSHSPGTAWDGVRRETVSQFIEDLYMWAFQPNTFSPDGPGFRGIFEAMTNAGVYPKGQGGFSEPPRGIVRNPGRRTGFKGFDDPWKAMSKKDWREANRLWHAGMKAFPSSPKQLELHRKFVALLAKYGIGEDH